MCVQIVDTDNIIKTTYNLQMWTEFEINFLKLHYPEYGKHCVIMHAAQAFSAYAVQGVIMNATQRMAYITHKLPSCMP